jgi:hypothetical protein
MQMTALLLLQQILSHGVIGNTEDSDSFVLGSSPGGTATKVLALSNWRE